MTTLIDDDVDYIADVADVDDVDYVDGGDSYEPLHNG